MSKKHLTDQQKRQIKANIDKSTKEAKINTSDLNLGSKANALVTAHFGQHIEISHNDKVYNAYLRQNLAPIAVGDNVVYQPIISSDNDEAVIINIKPRINIFERTKLNNITKPIAANLDQIILVVSLIPKPQNILIDQFLINAYIANIPVILVINKIDLIDKGKDYINIIKNIYNNPTQNLNYKVIETSIHQKDTIDNLYSNLLNKRSIFVGQSGVGKSSLLRTILPEYNIITGALVSKKKNLGAHTTTTAKLYKLPNNTGDVIDAPGIRELGVKHLSKPNITSSFPEFHNLIGKCKFKNCSHTIEPNCAFLNALKSNLISQSRWESFHNFMQA
tara:strand:- start:33624 stop:34625 length:1002 start_codon:yes stop_codon:yes gene_type:complete